jgi:uncharacterized integral membrane protein (TIGR00698 family)
MFHFVPRLRAVLPGLALCGAVTLAATLLERLEIRVAGRAWLESLVLAILLGAALRTLWRLDPRFDAGIQVGAKLLLEVAVVLLGASVSAHAVLEQGAALLAGIAVVVGLAILAGYGIGRALRLPPKMAILIACGNAICGNSAIAAVAPVIDADGRDVAAAIAFTAVLGVLVVLALPLTVDWLSFDAAQYGVFAGLTVYAVPQVLAATAPVSAASVHVGTVVKLVRVLMLGPVVLALSLLGQSGGRARSGLAHLVPWFIAGFLALLCLRSAGAIPSAALAPMHALSGLLTVMSMAALGLGVDARAVLRAGPRVAAVVVLSLLGLAAASLALLALLALPRT